MMIALSDGCPIFAPEYEVHLHRLLLTVAQRWHTVVNPSPDRMREILPEHIWNVYGSILSRQYRLSANSHQSWVMHRDCADCDAEKIGRFYSLPTLLVVENAGTDGAWVKLIVERIRPKISRFFGGPNPMVMIAQAGGIGEIPKELRRLSVPYLQSRPRDDVPLRVLALSDSDGNAPGLQSSSAADVDKVATEIGATPHVLRKRAIENYMPDDALHAYGNLRRDRQAAVLQILHLSVDARDYYPMKEGLSAGQASAIYPTGMELGLGLGDFIMDLITNLNHTIDGAGLRSRDGIGELEVFLEKLEINL
jgi:hypothetical protein